MLLNAFKTSLTDRIFSKIKGEYDYFLSFGFQVPILLDDIRVHYNEILNIPVYMILFGFVYFISENGTEWVLQDTGVHWSIFKYPRDCLLRKGFLFTTNSFAEDWIEIYLTISITTQQTPRFTFSNSGYSF